MLYMDIYIYGNIYHQYTPFMLVYIPYMDPMGVGYSFFVWKMFGTCPNHHSSMASLPPHGRPGAVNGGPFDDRTKRRASGICPAEGTGSTKLRHIPKSCFVSCVFHKWGYPKMDGLEGRIRF